MLIRRFRDWKIRSKLVSITLIMVMTPLFFAAYFSVTKFNQSLKHSAESDLAHIVNGLYYLAQAQEEILGQKVDKDMSFARSVLEGHQQAVRIRLDQLRKVLIRDQTNPSQSEEVMIPRMEINGKEIWNEFETVDYIQSLSGANCTIFQVIEGDRLLRVSTNAVDKNGQRAVGTYLPGDLEITRSVLMGQPYRGRMFAEGQWYITAYDPLLDESGDVVGALAVGVKGDESPALKHAIEAIVIGDTGYPYIMDTKGNLIFHPTRAGENIVDEKDYLGNYFIREMCKKAPFLKEHEVGTIRYPWINPKLGEQRPRYKIVKYQYFRNWDWVIAAGSYEEEIFSVIFETKTYISMVAGTTLVVVLVLTLMLSSVFTGPILALTDVTVRMARGDLTQKFQVDRNDEIGILGKSFNRMAEEIRKSTVYLEQIVSQRTRELAESRERYRDTSHMLNNILQASTEYAIVALDPEGVIFQYNTGAEKLFGWSMDEMVGKTPFSITYLPQKDWKGKFTDWLRNQLAGGGKCEYESFRKRKDGTEFPAHSIVTIIHSPDGEEIGFLEVCRDITERRRLEKQLKETRDFLKSIVESSVDVIVTTDQQGKITFLNPAIEPVLGYGRDELLDTHISKMYERGIDEAWDLMEQLVCKGLIRNYEMRLYRKDKTVVPIMTSSALLRDDMGRVIGTVGIFTDITKRKKLEAELQQAQQSLVQAVKLKAIGDLVAGVAHEINNPLMAAGAILHVMIEKKDGFDSETLRRLELLVQVNERIGGIVQHLRDFSRQSETTFDRISFNDPIENALLITRQQLLNHNIDIHTELAKDLPQIRGDRNQLEQVFLNFIANARDAMDEKGGDKKLHIRTYVTQDENWPKVVAEVTDTGGGIPEDVQSKIFDPFFSTKEVGKGTGLGLSICYGIIEGHDGTVAVDSIPGEGTTLKITIPAAPEDEEDQ